MPNSSNPAVETNTATLTDPRERFAKPPFPAQQQAPPGSSRELKPPADYGENSYTGHGRLKGRVALITGADSGIGRAVALCYAKEGADVLFTHLKEEKEDAEETVRLVEQTGRRAINVPGDIRTKEFCRKLVDQAFSELGRLDILVNNAGYQRTYEKLEDIPEDEFDATFRTNVYRTFFMTQAALPRMQPGGSIINTVSIESFTPEPSLAPYAATKAALASLTKSIAKMAMEQRGVRVNGVAPGPVWTPFIPSTMEPEKVKTFGQNTTFKRPAMPVEQAGIFVFWRAMTPAM
ncbi:SDR family NAD(P)-dependent oxidoreductase [Occallatibacter savannae]|uniref:SDR family NAD(P)-dependent oxidoreductase n=1 Tax=Occallatibacter savannae TaxID=1002691 RepID=UPI001EF5994F|nr:SDR family NAD(P)-dependent oxidoreductase [Occallatibacter savannae]